ncbi:MAG: hypothetical protein WKF66_20930 [Pedobacter sp.]
MNVLSKVASLYLLIFSIVQQADAQQQAGDFSVGKKGFLLNEKPYVMRAAELHYARIRL